jgi:DNA-binding NtrC family response regulator
MAEKVEILIIDDDRQAVELLSSIFKSRGYIPFGVYSGQKGIELALNDVFRLIFLDLTLPDMDSLEVLKNIKGSRVTAPVIVTSDEKSIQFALEASRLGTYCFIKKPIDSEQVVIIAENALQQMRLEHKVNDLQRVLSEQYDFIGRSHIIDKLREKLKRIAMSSSRVLFIGELGSGKRMAARYVHYCSKRATAPFKVVNCAITQTGLPYRSQGETGEWNLESKLFGYGKGAIAGATTYMKGGFEQADGGTLFLDNIGALNSALQAKLLQAIESGTIQRPGHSGNIKVDVRMLSASSINLEDEVKKGRFREDLYFRLNVIPVVVPPLRSHPEDIPLLARHFLDMAGYCHRYINDEGMERLKSYHWPGNVRELKNVIDRMVSLSLMDTLTAHDIKTALASGQTPVKQIISDTARGDMSDSKGLFRQGLSLKQHISDYEKHLLIELLKQCKGNITKVAMMLNTDRGNLSKKLKKLGIRNISKKK